MSNLARPDKKSQKLSQAEKVINLVKKMPLGSSLINLVHISMDLIV
jgi:hypothetical protein